MRKSEYLLLGSQILRVPAAPGHFATGIFGHLG